MADEKHPSFSSFEALVKDLLEEVNTGMSSMKDDIATNATEILLHKKDIDDHEERIIKLEDKNEVTGRQHLVELQSKLAKAELNLTTTMAKDQAEEKARLELIRERRKHWFRTIGSMVLGSVVTGIIGLIIKSCIHIGG